MKLFEAYSTQQSYFFLHGEASLALETSLQEHAADGLVRSRRALIDFRREVRRRRALAHHGDSMGCAAARTPAPPATSACSGFSARSAWPPACGTCSESW